MWPGHSFLPSYFFIPRPMSRPTWAARGGAEAAPAQYFLFRPTGDARRF